MYVTFKSTTLAWWCNSSSYKTLEDIHRRLQKSEDPHNSHQVVNLKSCAVTTETPIHLGAPGRKQGTSYRTSHSSMHCTASLSTEPKYRMQHFFHSSYNSGCGNSELFRDHGKKKKPSLVVSSVNFGVYRQRKKLFLISPKCWISSDFCLKL